MYDFPVDSIVRCANSPWLLARVKEVTFLLRHSTFGSDPRTYRKCVAIICSVIECTHKHKTEDISPETKRAFIRLLFAAYKVPVDVGKILWANRRDINLDDYRCLKHIISDESLPYNYDIDTYDDGEYRTFNYGIITSTLGQSLILMLAIQRFVSEGKFAIESYDNYIKNIRVLYNVLFPS
jgi:hypothetical protein